MPYTTDNLLTGVKRRGAIPSANATWQPPDILSTADDEIKTVLLPKITRARESYFSYDISFTITPTNGTYAIPTRSIGAKLQGPYLLDSSSGLRYPLNLVQEEEVSDLTVSPNGNPSFFFKSNNIVLLPPQPQSFDTLVMTIFLARSKLCQTSAAVQVTGISSNVVTVSSVPSTMTTSTPLDFIKGIPHYDLIALDQTPTATSSTTLTFATPPALSIGDWIALSGQTPVVQLPEVFTPLLEQGVANAFFRSQGFTQALTNGEKALEQMQDVFLLINPRSERTPKKILNRNGLLSRSNFWP